MGDFRTTRNRLGGGDRPVLRPGSWLLLVWMASAAILLDMRWEAVSELAFGDTDDAMRLVQTRDLLAGQGWFDRRQARLAPPDGVEMHWSRLPDAALAGLILAARPFLGEAAAERFAVAAWPLSLLLAWFALLFTLGKRLAGSREGGLVALFLGLLAIPAAGQFLPARIDHHGLQMVLLLAFVATAIRMPEHRWAAAAAGAIAALSLRIGLETLPILLAAEAALAVLWAREPGKLSIPLRLHGLAFAGAAMLALPATIAVSGWWTVHCDSFSIVYVAAALAAGIVWFMATAAGSRLSTPLQRFGLLAGAGTAAALLLLLLFPECRSGPYGMLESRLSALWLANVREAQSALDMLYKSPSELVAFMGFPLIGLLGLAWTHRSGESHAGRRFDWSVIGACFLAAVLTALWQIRGAFFANSLAVLPAACLVIRLLAIARALPAAPQRLAVTLAILALLNGLPFALVEQLTSPEKTAEQNAEADCRSAQALAPLAALPPSLVLSSIDLGPSILLRSRHAVLAAPYHRNTEGLATAIDIWTAAPKAAQAQLTARGVELVAVCPDEPDLRLFAREAGDGLAARLLAGAVPAWLEPVGAGVDTPITLYRVRPDRLQKNSRHAHPLLRARDDGQGHSALTKVNQG